MFLEFRDQAALVLGEALKKAGFEPEDVMSAAPIEGDPKKLFYEHLELKESDHADLASSISFRIAGRKDLDPAEIAANIASNINIPSDYVIGNAEAAGPYINFCVNDTFLRRTVEKILGDASAYGSLSMEGKIILEHTSANPNGPLHVGHIRNSIIGDTLARVLRRAGYDVETQYYVNDMGRQSAIVTWALDVFDFDETHKPDHAIADVYVAANKFLETNPNMKEEVDRLMQQYERGSEHVVEMFRLATELCLKGIKSTLNRLNIQHDTFVNEGDFIKSGGAQRIIDNIMDSKYAIVKDNALMLDLSKFGFEKELVIQRSNMTSLYVTRDLAYHQWKAKQCDRIIDVLGADHKLISSQLVKTLELLEIKPPEIIIFEFVSLPEGSMSTREGKFISADELLSEVEERAYLEVDRRRGEMNDKFKRETAKVVGVGAVRYDIIKVSPEKATTFNWDDAVDFEKQGAPFIQYSHARACSILRKAEGVMAKLSKSKPYDEYDPGVLTHEQEIRLIKKLSMFPRVIEVASQELKPHVLAVYARELADAFNQFYRDVPVLNADKEQRKARLALVECTRIVLANTLDTLGISAPESM